MSYKIRKLVVGKGKTTSNEKAGEWIKNYYEVEIEIPDEHELSIAKENVEGLLNDWLGIAEQPSSQRKLSVGTLTRLNGLRLKAQADPTKGAKM